MPATKVNADNFSRAETHRMMADLQRDAGRVNQFMHNREPAAIDRQTVIRLNRDTLYSFAVVDISAGAVLTVPDAGDRYLSVMVVNEDHYINRVLHDAGDHHLTAEELGSPYVVVAARTLVDPRDPDDLAAVAAVQDRLGLSAASGRPFGLPDYETGSFDRTRSALLALAAEQASFERSFGRQEDVDPVRHLIGSAAGWGGLPDAEAAYVGVAPGLPVGEYELTVPVDVPVDGFWSISVYNADGFFEPNVHDAYTVNSITAARNGDGSVTVRFGGSGENSIPVPEGWNYLVRLYRPRPEILSGAWSFPALDR
ncbi:DUF1254 domain-containing protein [Nocardioides sp. S-58]|uniref:DUF1254 domain-containing protein n=1 Tax=Nocardioides renjunii TaxID=3095075 RepID=A0ABU5KBJ4_9ACTN|nr:DUF1254 domain-containing protein [Nocardioides sp. S-58]MDZ5662212.1 DUF1254 domain-containing protein [Nocardioides sp. S-58]